MRLYARGRALYRKRFALPAGSVAGPLSGRRAARSDSENRTASQRQQVHPSGVDEDPSYVRCEWTRPCANCRIAVDRMESYNRTVGYLNLKRVRRKAADRRSGGQAPREALARRGGRAASSSDEWDHQGRQAPGYSRRGEEFLAAPAPVEDDALKSAAAVSSRNRRAPRGAGRRHSALWVQARHLQRKLNRNWMCSAAGRSWVSGPGGLRSPYGVALKPCLRSPRAIPTGTRLDPDLRPALVAVVLTHDRTEALMSEYSAPAEGQAARLLRSLAETGPAPFR